MGTNPRATTQITESIAEELRTYRARRKMRLVDVSRMSGVPVSTLSRLFSGERAINLDEFVRVCAALEIDPGDVLDDVAEVTAEVLKSLTTPDVEAKPQDASNVRSMHRIDPSVWEVPAAALDPGMDDYIEREQEAMEEYP